MFSMPFRKRMVFVCLHRGCGQTRKAFHLASPRCPRGHGELAGVWPLVVKPLMRFKPRDRHQHMTVRAIFLTPSWVKRYVCEVR